jgi:hypothetical protein
MRASPDLSRPYSCLLMPLGGGRIMRKFMLFLAVSLTAVSFVPALAQTPQEEHGPPKVLLFVREDIKPGLMAAHNKHSAIYAGIFSKLQTPNHRIAMVPVAGSENEVVYLTGCDSFADLEKLLKETDKKMSTVNASTKLELDRLDKEAGSLHAGMRDLLAVYRPEMSFNPAAPIPQMRYFSVSTVRIRPGHEAQYLDYVQKTLNIARTKAKLPENFHIAVYQVISGAPSGTFLVFRPMKSLAELDSPIGRTVRSAMTEDMKKDADKAYGEAVISSENITYAFMPKLSFLPKEFTSMDAAFWTPQSPVAASPKPKKRGNGTSARQ